jgi:acetylglutamate kinase
MTKAHLAIAVATALISIVTALPASAAVISCDSGRILDQNGRYVSRVQAFSAEITQELRRQGINASSVEDWNGCIRAYVTEGGHTSMQYFDPGTYERLQ